MPEFNDLALESFEVAARNGYVPTPDKMLLILADHREARQKLREAQRVMPTSIEDYALACDETGLWALDASGPWRSGTILDDSEADRASKEVLADHGILCAPVRHQTSCRTVIGSDGRSSQVNTFLAIVPIEGSIPAQWPLAEGIDLELLRSWGLPEPHASDEVPIVNDANVLMHGLRHFKWLSNPLNDATRARDLADLGVTPHLEPLEEDLARLFRQEHQPAA